MAAISLIKFTQGALTDLAGRALKGEAGLPVTVENGDNTDVLSWVIELLYAPPGSGIATGVIASNANDSTPTTTFTPDVAGCYRVRLTVWDAISYGGTQNVDIRNFAVPLSQNIIQPPYQTHPPQLPVQGSGFPGEKPDEMNFGGQVNGWAGDANPSRKLLHQTLGELNDLLVRLPAPTNDGVLTAEKTVEMSFPQRVNFDDRGYLWVGNGNFSDNTNPNNGVVSGPPTPEPGQLEQVWTYPQTTTLYQRTPLTVYSPVSDSIFAGRYINSGISLQELTKTYPITEVRPPVLLNSFQNLRGLIEGGGYLWVASDATVWRVDPLTYSTTGVDVIADSGTTPVGYNDGTLLYVDDPIFGDGFGRFFFVDTNDEEIHRFHPDTLAHEASYDIPNVSFQVTGAAYDPTKQRIGVMFRSNLTYDAQLSTFDAEPLGDNLRMVDLDPAFNGGQHFSVVYEPISDRYWCYGYDSSNQYRGVIARVEDTGSTLAIESVFQTGIEAYDYYSPTYPQLTVYGGYVWVVCIEEGLNPPNNSYRILRVDPTDDSVAEVSRASRIYWGGLDLRGAVTGSFQDTALEYFGNADGPRVDSYAWEYGGSYVRPGMVPRLESGGARLNPAYLPATQLSSLTASTFTWQSYNNFQGWCIRRSTSSFTWTAQIRPLYAAPAGYGQSSNHRLYMTDISGRLGEDDHIFASNRYGSIIPTTANASYRIYGITGIGRSPQLGTASFQMNTPYENIELTWSSEHQGWVITNRYRPWEDVERPNPVNPSSIGLSTGKAMVHVDTRTAAQGVNLSSIARHDDWCVVKDSWGNASANNITIGGSGKLIDGQGSVVIDADYGSMVFRYDAGGNGGVGSWEILSSNGNLGGSGGVAQWEVVAIVTAASTALTSGRKLVRVDATGGTRTLTLPSSPTAFDEFIIKDYYGVCSNSSNRINVNAAAGFDGGTAGIHVIALDFGALHVIWDGTNWVRV